MGFLANSGNILSGYLQEKQSLGFHHSDEFQRASLYSVFGFLFSCGSGQEKPVILQVFDKEIYNIDV